MANTLLYLTDNSLDPSIAEPCKRILLREADGLPIVSVSQKPMDFGTNVCVGEIGRSWMSIYKQILAGLEAVETEWLCVIEHDVLYTSEHLNYHPSDPKVFWYNGNHWLVQWHGNHPEIEGMYSYRPSRYAVSQLICTKSQLKASTQELVDLIERGMKVQPGTRWYGEPGAVDSGIYQAAVEAIGGSSSHWHKHIVEYLSRYTAQFFRTDIPNLDIRHNGCFTGPKRGKKRCYELPYWGKFEDVINGMG